MDRAQDVGDRTAHCDIALLHPPHSFVEEYSVFPLPWSPRGSTTYIGRYPIGTRGERAPLGFTVMKNFIERRSNYTVHIYNLPALGVPPIQKYLPKNIGTKFASSLKEDRSIMVPIREAVFPGMVRSAIKKIDTDLFAVDLHWLTFSHGAIQILKLAKEIHPGSYTLLGGFTATYFRDEIMESFPFIDFLIRGDGCVPLLKLIQQIKTKKDFSRVPNLLYREKGRVKKGRVCSLNDFPYAQEDQEPSDLIPFARGCPLQCITCGGSKYASRKIGGYRTIKPYSVESIMRKLSCLSPQDAKNSQPHLIHDPFLTLGKKKWEMLLDEIKNNKMHIPFRIEFFMPHSKKDILNIEEKIPGTVIHLSPQSIDEDVRAHYKNLRYSNKDLVMNMELINGAPGLFLGLWFFAGLAKDSKESIDKTLSFTRRFYKKLRSENFIGYDPLVFIDPGSAAFDSPAQYHYRLVYKNFLEHRQGFAMPIFKYQINYRTADLCRDRLFDLFLYMHNQMNRIYLDNGVISGSLYDRAMLYNRLLGKYAREYDRVLSLTHDQQERARYFKIIGESFRGELER